MSVYFKILRPPKFSMRSRRQERIVCPQRIRNGGLDFKFETDPYNVELLNIMTQDEFTNAMTRINESLKPARSTKVDIALLSTGVLMFPLALWGVRNGMQAKKRKRLLLRAIDEFNERHPTLLMRWNRRPESCLTIEKRPTEVEGTLTAIPIADEPHGMYPLVLAEPSPMIPNQTADLNYNANTSTNNIQHFAFIPTANAQTSPPDLLL
jgi:hypothetical protein